MNKIESQNLLSSLINTPIKCNRTFAEITGLLSAGTLITFLVCITENSQNIPSAVDAKLSDSVELRDDFLRGELGMSDSEIYSAKRRLRHLNFIETKTQGRPIKTLYKCNRQVIQLAVIEKMNAPINDCASLVKNAETYVQHRLSNQSKDSKEYVSDIVSNVSENKNQKLDKDKERSRKRRECDYTADDTEYQLAMYLHNRIIRRRPNFFGLQERTAAQTKKKIKSWAKEMDMVIHKRNDGRDAEEALDVLVWSQNDPFWQKVITSPYKFREKYGQLLDYMEGSTKKNTEHVEIKDTHPEITEKLTKMYIKSFLGGKAPKWSLADKGKFVRASRKISVFATETDLMIVNIPEYLIECLKSNFTDRGSVVYPGNLFSDNTWDILMPQYLKELGINYCKKT